MSPKDESIKKQCNLFKMLGNATPGFCEKQFIPKVEWQKFCSNENKCHDEYWRIIYHEKKMVNKRLDRLEKETGISK